MAEGVAITGQIERREDFGTDPPSIVKRWLAEVRLGKAAMKWEGKGGKDWYEKAAEIHKLYRFSIMGNTKAVFNICYANTETMMPAFYSAMPKPDVRRRFTDSRQPMPEAREGALTLEKAVRFSLEDYDFDEPMEGAVMDFSITGRGLARVRYIPHYGEVEREKLFLEQVEGNQDEVSLGLPQQYVDEDGNQVEPDAEIFEDDDLGPYMLGTETYRPVVHEEVRCEYVYYKHFIHAPARTWSAVRWVAFEHHLTRDELKDLIRDKALAGAVRATVAGDGTLKEEKQGETPDIVMRIRVYEIWDREKRQVWLISPDHDEQPLDRWDDPLGLRDFFPVPRPAYFVRSTEDLRPVPPYLIYEEQAAELNSLTRRIGLLIKAIKAACLYAGEQSALLDQLFKSAENSAIPVTDWDQIKSHGGLKGLIEWFPTEKLAETLVLLIGERERLKAIVFELSGLSDIMRGQTDPRETRGAQEIKSRFGQLRLHRPKKEIERFARDLIRLKAEIIAEKFSPETIAKMTGTPLEVPDPQDMAAIAAEMQQQVMATQQAAQQGQPAQPPVPRRPRMIPNPIFAFLRNEGMRNFRIQVETDSTVMPDEQQEKKDRIEFITAMAGLFEKVGPMVTSGHMDLETLKAITMFGVRGFKIGREIEETLEKALSKPPPPKEDEKDQGSVMRGQAAMMTAQAKAQQIQQTGERDRARFQVTLEEQRHEQRMRELELQIESYKAQTERATAETARLQARIEAARLGIEQQDADTKRMDAGTKRMTAMKPEPSMQE